MDNQTQELQVIDQAPKDITISRPPDVVLAEAQRAAAALADVISKKKKPVMFNGEQYLEFEDWQTIGKFYGLVVKTGDAQEIMIEQWPGAKAHADVVDVRTGNIIGSADAWCMRDEANWKNKPWFQLASMAQTRAGAKALRNVLSWVVVLAGYRGTPAEEMAEVVQTPKPRPTPAKSNPAHEGIDSTAPTVISEIKTFTTKSGDTYWVVKDSEGAGYSTFDDKLFEQAKNCKDTQKEVTIDYSVIEKNGKLYSNLVAIR